MVHSQQSAGHASCSAPGSQGSPAQGLPALPLRAGHIPLGDLIDFFMAHYSGRDRTLAQRLSWWKARRGSVPLQDLSDDHAQADLESLANQSSRFYAGKDGDGRPIYKAKKKLI